MDHVTLRDGRRMDIRVTGPDDGPVLVLHHGTPGAATQVRSIEHPAHERGLRVVITSRPGYGDSTRSAGRRVVDVVPDIRDVLDALGVDSCLVAGASGGGPHALACAARLDGVLAALAIAGVGQFEADGLDFLAGMGDDNIVEFGAAVEGEDSLRSFLDVAREAFKDVTVEGLIEQMDSLLPDVDRVCLSDELGEDAIIGMHEAVRTGVDGWLDDDLAFVAPWRFDLAEITVPTMIWQGSADLMVPFAHGQWLASQMPQASVHLEQGEGHLSLAVGSIDVMLDELMSAAGLT